MKIFFIDYRKKNNYHIDQIVSSDVHYDFFPGMFSHVSDIDNISHIRNKICAAIFLNDKNQIIFILDDQNIDSFLDTYTLLY